MTYAETIKNHLACYNRDTLKSREPGEFNHRGTIHKMWHILQKDEWPRNFLESCRPSNSDRVRQQLRVPLRAGQKQHITLHRYFHHLNSSQALCMNLFLPLIRAGKERWFLEFCDIDAAAGDIRAEFEKESKHENSSPPNRKTSFDFYVQWGAGPQHVFVEVKYSKDGFGGAKNDRSHRDKYASVYKPMLDKACPYFRAEIKCEEFLKDYQILRNLVHISENSHVIFLVPRANTKVVQAADSAIEKYLSPAGQTRCRVVYLEGFLDDLLKKTRGMGDPLEVHFREFERRYFPDCIREFGRT